MGFNQLEESTDIFQIVAGIFWRRFNQKYQLKDELKEK
jgi:hypothetical protein